MAKVRAQRELAKAAASSEATGVEHTVTDSMSSPVEGAVGSTAEDERASRYGRSTELEIIYAVSQQGA